MRDYMNGFLIGFFLGGIAGVVVLGNITGALFAK